MLVPLVRTTADDCVWWLVLLCRLPTPVQAEAVPLILGGGDVMAVRYLNQTIHLSDLIQPTPTTIPQWYCMS
jgi:hypothetical protein